MNGFNAMPAGNARLSRREFIQRATVIAGMASAAAPLIAVAGEAFLRPARGFHISATARFTSAKSASRRGSR